ncbi:hypothetical protein Ocin01_00778 [Orchesella cincta]|uniref:SITS-binding protein n=1 Tax=Orchesella cincta TaxID=48709 RepID=A0A1D2NL15_ORCCI|nr:hypothetical protein Ocin01_00778 [Orchesella cincta]
MSYGGGTTYNQTWPLNTQIIPDSAFVTGDYTSTTTGAKYGGVIENYFLFSNGIAMHIDEDTPLFVGKQLCISAKNEYPYKFRENLELKYDVCVGNNIRHVHQSTFPTFYEKPTRSPDQDMILKPFWSTWNEFNANVNQSIVIQHARRILEEGFSTNSHFEIDDGWEECYGQNTFNSVKFPDPAGMVQELNELGFRVTLWTHIFINYECKELFNEAFSKGYLLKDKKGKSAFTTWWHGDAGVVNYGIDAFKFDAGETDRLPWEFVLTEGSELSYPNDFTRAYVDAVSLFGGLIEVRTGSRSQGLPIFTRMLDKGSRWGYDNGLQSLIPSLLQFGILGYSYALPDMIGGNNYKPSAELWIRWLQANAFMPAVQFSIVPWSYPENPELSEITKTILAIREENWNEILHAVNSTISDGSPINRPMWWVDPEDRETYNIDDQYMLGDNILVAPVLTENSTSRDIYLPRGSWFSNTGIVFDGPVWLRNYSAPIQDLPYFKKL